MQPCDSCGFCSFPSLVEEAKRTLPERWVAELTEEEAPDSVWAHAKNMMDILTREGIALPESFLDSIVSGNIDEEDIAWARRVVVARESAIA